MHQSSALVLLANGFLPSNSLGPPAGGEAIYRWAWPGFLSLATLILGLWLVRVRHVRTGQARALLWAGTGCLAICYSAWGVGAYQGWGVFYPAWASWWAFPILAVIALCWWLVRQRLSSTTLIRPRLETLAGCLAVGYFGWWLCAVFLDLNWFAQRGWGIWLTVAMPWLWAGGFGAVIWKGWQARLPSESRRVQAACAWGASIGFVVWCVVGSATRDLLYAVLGVQRDHEVGLVLAILVFSVFAFSGALICASVTPKGVEADANDGEVERGNSPTNAGDDQSPAATSPASTSSG